MQKIRVNEVFGPAGYWNFEESAGEFENTFVERWGVTQGEGRFVGQPSVFIRTFGCNFECRGFGLPKGEQATEPEEYAKNVHMYRSINDVPPATYGCDSYYSWHPEFKHLSPFLNVDALAEMVLKAAGGTFFGNANGVHLILTGGEPMLGWQKAYPALIAKIQELDPNWKHAPWRKLKVTIETNGTQQIIKHRDPNGTPPMFELAKSCDITWSISPKLSASGHSAEEAIRPEIIRQYSNVSPDMYFKFVVQDISDFADVESAMKSYSELLRNIPVYIMPEGGTESEFKKHATLELVAEAVRRGYNVTPRLHVMWGGNNVGW